jgi:cytochrome c2
MNKPRISLLTRGTALGLTALILTVGCQANVVTVHNLGGPTSGPTQTLAITEVATGAATSSAIGAAEATSAVTLAATGAATSSAAPTDSAMPGMTMPTQAGPVVTLAATSAVGGPTATQFVAANLIFGTPVPSQQVTESQTSISTTPTQFVAGNLVFGSPVPTVIGGVSTQAAQPTLPPTSAPATMTSNAAGASASAADGNPVNGKAIFSGVAGCGACHDVSQNITIVGPSLIGIATRAATRVKGMSAQDYIRNHITNPDLFTVPGFPAGVMPKTFSQTLTPTQINDVVAFLLTLK